MDINEYFSNTKYFKNKIIVIAAKDEASRLVGRIKAKEALGLNMHIGYRNSYVAVIDMKRSFVYENVLKDSYECSYKVGKRFVDIFSAGFGNGNRASIKVGDNEYSTNRRGLNIVVLHYKSLALVDRFFVDTNEDTTLTVKRG